MADTIEMKTVNFGDGKVYEVVDAQAREDLAAEQKKLETVYENAAMFGFIEHMAIEDPASRITYIGVNTSYTPMTVDTTNHTTDYGSWSLFPSVLQNKPYMVKSTGEADYQLDESDYTKKASDGSDSDVANTEYDGGAFSKFIKIYKKEWVEGTDRHVRFMYSKGDGYNANGFIDTDGSEMDYIWMPMFYGATVDDKLVSLSGLQPTMKQNTATQKTAIEAFSSRAAFFAGPVIETIRDMLYMLFKTTDIQTACGKGNCSGYDSTNTDTYGILANAVVDGGQFYGTTDGKSLNKIFHSIVLGSYQQWQRDPYLLLVNGNYKVSKNYTYDVSGATYEDVGFGPGTVDANGWKYPDLNAVAEGFGSLPVSPYGGSTALGYCDGVYILAIQSGSTYVALRFGCCSDGSNAGPGALALHNSAGIAHWSIGGSVLLKPVAA